MYDLCERIAGANKLANDYKNLDLDMIRNFGINDVISESDFNKDDVVTLANKLYEKAFNSYREKSERTAQEAFKVIKNVYENNNGSFERIVVPFTDGIKTMNIVTNLEEAYNSEGKSLIDDFEKSVTLAILDEAWKKHLRKMDELKQSVQLAVHEQKDPLLIYKFEAFELFQTTIGEMDSEVTSFLTKADLPVQPTEEQV